MAQLMLGSMLVIKPLMTIMGRLQSGTASSRMSAGRAGAHKAIGLRFARSTVAQGRCACALRQLQDPRQLRTRASRAPTSSPRSRTRGAVRSAAYASRLPAHLFTESVGQALLPRTRRSAGRYGSLGEPPKLAARGGAAEPATRGGTRALENLHSFASFVQGRRAAEEAARQRRNSLVL